ncbi:MAG: DEAD/DEAH box helicase, partial [bacterium]
MIANWFSSQFAAPSPPQSKGWPVIAAGQHCLILSPTGSGKTLAAFLWCLDELFRTGV